MFPNFIIPQSCNSYPLPHLYRAISMDFLSNRVSNRFNRFTFLCKSISSFLPQFLQIRFHLSLSLFHQNLRSIVWLSLFLISCWTFNLQDFNWIVPVKDWLGHTNHGTHKLRGLLGKPNDNDQSSCDGVYNENGIEVRAFDNRGMCLSSIPKNKSEYTTRIMATDAVSVMDHLGWKKAHVFGHSMGGMIACKLAALFPDRILSLSLLNVTGGGGVYESSLSLIAKTLSIAMRFLMAKTPEQRAVVDLDTHTGIS